MVLVGSCDMPARGGCDDGRRTRDAARAAPRVRRGRTVAGRRRSRDCSWLKSAPTHHASRRMARTEHVVKGSAAPTSSEKQEIAKLLEKSACEIASECERRRRVKQLSGPLSQYCSRVWRMRRVLLLGVPSTPTSRARSSLAYCPRATRSAVSQRPPTVRAVSIGCGGLLTDFEILLELWCRGCTIELFVAIDTSYAEHSKFKAGHMESLAALARFFSRAARSSASARPTTSLPRPCAPGTIRPRDDSCTATWARWKMCSTRTPRRPRRCRAACRTSCGMRRDRPGNDLAADPAAARAVAAGAATHRARFDLRQITLLARRALSEGGGGGGAERSVGGFGASLLEQMGSGCASRIESSCMAHGLWGRRSGGSVATRASALQRLASGSSVS